MGISSDIVFTEAIWGYIVFTGAIWGYIVFRVWGLVFRVS